MKITSMNFTRERTARTPSTRRCRQRQVDHHDLNARDHRQDHGDLDEDVELALSVVVTVRVLRRRGGDGAHGGERGA
jgi:hypothetical protein